MFKTSTSDAAISRDSRATLPAFGLATLGDRKAIGQCLAVLDMVHQMYQGAPVSLTEVAKATKISVEITRGMINFWVSEGQLKKVDGTETFSPISENEPAV